MIKKFLFFAAVLLLFSSAHAQIGKGTVAYFNDWTLTFETDIDCDVANFYDNVFECVNVTDSASSSSMRVDSDGALINISLYDIYNLERLNFSALNTSANTNANITLGVFKSTDSVRIYHDGIEDGALGPLTPNASGYVSFTWDFTGEKNFEFKAPPYRLDLNSPANGYTSSSSNVTFSWTGYDSSTNMTANLTIDGAVNVSDLSTNNGVPTTQNVSGFSERSHSWRVTVVDAAGNARTSATYSFTVDFTPDDPGNGGVGGGGGGSTKVTAFKDRQTVVKNETMVDVIKELGLGSKYFCRVKREAAAVFAVTGRRNGDYPVPDTDVSSALANPVMDVDGDIYERSASEVLRAWDSSDKVVIARGDLETDSMAAIAYAKANNAPILLTKPEELPSDTLYAIDELNVSSFVIIGGEEAVSAEVADELAGFGSVERISGKDRYETAGEIAKALEKLKEIDTIVIADGERPSMDTAIIAAGYSAPVLYVSGDIVPQSTKDFIKSHRVTKRGKEVKLVFADVSGYIINYRLDKDF